MQAESSIVVSLFLIFAGAALIATLALYARQALIVGYIILGVLLGPWMLGWVGDTALIRDIAEVGIIILLFLLGLDLSPRKLVLLLKQTTLVTFSTSVVFCFSGWVIARFFGFSQLESLLAGISLMFSSTIIAVKLLPTTVLHHKHTGEVIISVLLLQDLIAILALLVLQGFGQTSGELVDVVLTEFGKLALAVPALVGVAYVLERFVLFPLFHRFDGVQEYVFLLTIAWCLGISQLAHTLGLSYEIGAFIAGVMVAPSRISPFIALSLKPVRDFFLVLFFFALGAGLDLGVVPNVVAPAMALAIGTLIFKPLVFRFALASVAETPLLAWETGWRLGQLSEFTLLITFLAQAIPQFSAEAVVMIQLATLITFIGSSTIVVLNFPTPVAVSDRLRRD